MLGDKGSTFGMRRERENSFTAGGEKNCKRPRGEKFSSLYAQLCATTLDTFWPHLYPSPDEQDLCKSYTAACNSNWVNWHWPFKGHFYIYYAHKEAGTSFLPSPNVTLTMAKVKVAPESNVLLDTLFNFHWKAHKKWPGELFWPGCQLSKWVMELEAYSEIGLPFAS